MLLLLVFLILVAIFMTALLLATRTGAQDRQMEARFALLQTAGPGGLSSIAANSLLKKTAAASGWFALLLAPMLARMDFTKKLQTLALQANKPTTPSRFLLTCAICGVVGLLLSTFVLPSLLVAVLVGLGASYAPMLVLQFHRKRRLDAFNKSLPELIEMMARSLRAGHALVAAISIVAEQAPEPARAEFAEVFRQQNFGLPLREALMQLLDRIPSQDLRVLVTGILVQKDTGGNLTQILDRIATVIRERLKLQGEVRVHTAQGRMTGWILCLLPVVMLLLIDLINPGYSKPLTDNPFGRKLLYIGIGLLCTGAFIIRQIVNGIEI